MTYKSVDFFCGAGGLSRGLADAGLSVICGIDIDPTLKQTFEHNNKIPFLAEDIFSLRPSDLESYLMNECGYRRSDKLVFAACAPCQPFSKLSRRESDDKSRQLLIRFVDFVKYFKPIAILCENVPSFRETSEFASVSRRLKKLGYRISFDSVNFAEYGVPQSRERFVVTAGMGFEIEIPRHVVNQHATVKDSIAHFPEIKAGETSPFFPNHFSSSLSKDNLKRIRATPHDGGSADCWPKKLWLNSRKENSKIFRDVYGRMFWDRPSPTLTTRCISYSNGRFGHPAQDRAISLREAAALQSFREDYIFFGSVAGIAKQIGNAVPPLSAQVLGKNILTALGSNDVG